MDRLKELIKYKGYQGEHVGRRRSRAVAPAELEALLLTHPSIADAAVIGIYSSSQATELPRAYIVPTGLQSGLAQDVATWVAGRVASHKRLRGGVVLVDKIPKSPSGKILRRELRLRAAEEAQREEQGNRHAKL